MLKTDILTILREDGGFVSGQAMSERLGVTRAAVWKAIRALREDGYELESVNNRGYRLSAAPDRLSLPEIQAALGDHPWAGLVTALGTVDSTNNYAKKLAASGAPHGTVVVADEQTGGRGRLGRAFSSPGGVGVYLTVLLRPKLPPQELGHMTAMAAVATCDAVEQTCGLRPGIKWTNDLVVGRKKLVGILTELSVEWESGTTDYVIIGIGVNVNHQPSDFPPEVAPMATSLAQVLGHPVRRAELAARMIERLYALSQECVTGKAAWLNQYALDCVTIGQDIKIIRGSETRFGHADGIDENGGLLVTYQDGTHGTVASGEVSVRGMYGYIN